jgi:hypothetical protein
MKIGNPIRKEIKQQIKTLIEIINNDFAKRVALPKSINVILYAKRKITNEINQIIVNVHKCVH